MRDLFCFLHIPKTGGTSFVSFLENNFAKDRIWRFPRGDDQVDWSKVECIHGHFPVTFPRVAECFPGVEPIFITLLREPVSRAISWYYHGIGKRTTEQWLHDHRDAMYMISNTMTYYLQSSKCDRLQDLSVDSAFDTLHNRVVFGFTEYFNEFLSCLWSWKPEIFHTMEYERKNVNQDKPEEHEPGLVEMLTEMNQKDMELYRRAMKLCDSWAEED